MLPGARCDAVRLAAYAAKRDEPWPYTLVAVKLVGIEPPELVGVTTDGNGGGW